jgi:cholesterol transport system auxiliary component
MRAVAAMSLGLVLAGCALTSKADPVEIRFFSPEPVGASPTVRSSSSAPSAAPPGLRFGRITSASMLKRAIVYRRGPSELAAYDRLQWTEEPEQFARRAISRALFESRFKEVVAGAGPVLEVELVSFEEVRRGTARLGRVELRYLVRDHREVFVSSAIEVEREARGPEIDAVVAAIAEALVAAAERLAEETEAALAAPNRQP